MTLTVGSHSQPIPIWRELTRSGALARAVSWQPALGAILIVAAVLAWRAGDLADPGAATNMLRGVAVLLSLGVLFVLDDRATALVESVPLRLAFRLGLRVLIAASLCGVGFGASVAVVRAATADASPSVIGGVAVELLATMLFGLAIAAIAARFWAVDEPGIVAAPTVLGLWMALALMPAGWAMIVAPGPQWFEAHLRWGALVVVSAVALAVASRDPGSRRLSNPSAAQPSRLQVEGAVPQQASRDPDDCHDDYFLIRVVRRLGSIERTAPAQTGEARETAVVGDPLATRLDRQRG